MIKPDFADKDAALEYAAQEIEEGSFADLSGIFSKRKRGREDADLRFRTIQETRQSCARHIRAMKSRHDLDAVEVLRRLANEPNGNPGHLMDAWPLAWKGWLNILATVRCNSNCVPPEVSFRIELTDKGREILAQTPVAA